jgi:hypothetical protein
LLRPLEIVVGQHPLVGICALPVAWLEVEFLHVGRRLFPAGVEELLRVVGPCLIDVLASVTTSCIKLRARKFASSSWQRADASPAVRSTTTLPSNAASGVNLSAGTR